MGFKCGIIGLPNVGKSTIFNVLTKTQLAAAENYPFCTIEPNEGTVPVPDPRLDKLTELVKPLRTLSSMMTFVDIAGLVKGAAEGEGLGNRFLGHIRETQAIVQVVRCFENEDIIHVSGQVNPLSDISVIGMELAIADLETVSKALEKAQKFARSGDKERKEEAECLQKVKDWLNQGKPVRQLALSEKEKGWLNVYCLLTAKPMLYVGNVDENGFENNPHWKRLVVLAAEEGCQAIPICASLESQLVDLDPEDQQAFLAECGFQEPGLNRLIRAGYDLLGLQSFFTAGEKEVRAWTVPIGATAVKSAAVIHTDFEKHFIRAEVIAYEDYVHCGSEQKAKELGKWRLEGKDYVVQSGDVIYFRIGG